MADEFDTNEGLTRREALKKGAMLGGALVWAVPVVQTVGMSAAMAREPSEGECCLRIVSFSASKFAQPPSAAENDIKTRLTLKNCGEFDVGLVFYRIERKLASDPDIPANWTFRNTGNPGTLNPGDVIPFEDESYGLPPQTYVWRATVTSFTCQGTDYTQQTQPASQWVLSNQVTIA